MADTIGITREEFNKLAAPFTAKDHEFTRGFIYIEETAICSRIEEVDFSWEWKTISVTRENDVAIVVGALTINGITRYGTGQQIVQRDAKGNEANGEAAKGASTDALKRAARLFGIGRYLLQCPSTVKDYGPGLNSWLSSMAKGQAAPQIQEPVNAPHWSLDTATMDRLYKRAYDDHKMALVDVQRAIAASRKSITSLSQAEAWAIVTAASKKAAS